jgi:hypothetical protein
MEWRFALVYLRGLFALASTDPIQFVTSLQFMEYHVLLGPVLWWSVDIMVVKS